MRYYLAPYELRTSESSEPTFEPVGVSLPWSSADLRPDPTNVAGFALTEVPRRVTGPIATRLVDLGEDPTEPLPLGIRTALGNVLGLNLQATTLISLLGELFLQHAGPGRWKPLLPNPVRGVYEVVLGAARWEMPVVAGGATITEDWDCPDSTSLNCDLTWNEISGDGFEIVSNAARSRIIAAATYFARAEHDLASSDHYCQADLLWNGATSNTAGVLVRFSSSAATGYEGDGNRNGSVRRIVKVVAGGFTTLASEAFTPGASTWAFRLEASGSSLRLLVNGVEELAVTDTAITGNTRCGLRAQTVNTAGAYARWDNFQAGDLAVSHPSALLMARL